MDGSLDPVRILDADSQDTLQDTLWDGAKLDLGHTSHLLEPPKALEPNVENGSKKRKFAPDLNASNDPPLKPASTIPSTVANSTIQTEDAVKRSEKRCKDMTETKSPRRFACPFRKHNPQRYSYPEWRHCALSAFESIARVKGHLYRHHRIFCCLRCKTAFRSSDEVDHHTTSADVCVVSHEPLPEGVDSHMVVRLRNKKNIHGSQAEEERWGHIYKIIFPGAFVPSPFFDPVIDPSALSPDYPSLAKYEEYSRRELPRVFRHSLEGIIKEGIHPFEATLSSRLHTLIRDCQDRVFSSYQAEVEHSNLTKGHGETRLLEIGAHVSVENDHRRQLGKKDSDAIVQDVHEDYPPGEIRHMFQPNNDTISYSGTPSLTTGMSTIKTSSEDDYLPSSAMIHNTEFPCLVHGCLFRGNPREWLESKHYEQTHEASSNQNLGVVENVSEVPNIEVCSTSGVLNGGFRYLGNNHHPDGSIEGETSSCHDNNPHLLSAEVNAALTRVAAAVSKMSKPQMALKSGKSGNSRSSHDSFKDLKTTEGFGNSKASKWENDSDFGDPNKPLDLSETQKTIQMNQMEVVSDGTSREICSSSCQDMLDDADARNLDSSLSSAMSSSTTTRTERDGRVEMLVKPVLLALGESFIDRLVEELQYGQTGQGSDCSDVASRAHSSPSSSSAGQTKSTSTSASTVSAITSINGIKRGVDATGNNSGGDDGEGEDYHDRKRERGRNGQLRKSRKDRPFACPYRKNDPKKYSFNNPRYKTCVTGSWPDISHLKEHIERVHRAKCSSCNVFIKDEKEHQAHSENSALHQMGCKIDGLSEDAMRLMKQVKSHIRGRHAAWDAMYTHLCPETSPIPDPWFENEREISSTEDKADLRKKVESFLPQEIAAFIETRPDIIECFTARLRERFRNDQTSDQEPEFVAALDENVAEAAQSVPQVHPSGSNIPMSDTNHQDAYLDWGTLDFSDLTERVSENASDAYQRGYEAGHEEGYQQGQKDGYQAGKKVTARTQNLASNQGVYRQGANIDSMATSAPQASGVGGWDPSSGMGNGLGGFDPGLLSNLTDNWLEDIQD